MRQKMLAFLIQFDIRIYFGDFLLFFSLQSRVAIILEPTVHGHFTRKSQIWGKQGTDVVNCYIVVLSFNTSHV